MKALGIVCMVAVAGTLAASAATEQWRVAATGSVIQIVADGSGGCAFLRSEAGTNYVVWLNKKGKTIYRSLPIGTTMILGGVHQCTPKQLLFTSVMFPMIMMVQVDTKGVETPVVMMGGFVMGAPMAIPITFNKLADPKGFFIYNVNTNTAAGAVVRYTFK